jgi:hypothetical protein
MGIKSNSLAKPSSVEIIPSTELTGIEGALRSLSIDEARLAELWPKADRIVVNSPEKALEAGAILKEIRDIKKAGDRHMAPYKDVVKRALDWIRNKVTAHEMLAAKIEQPLAEKLATFQREDRERTQKEQQERDERREKEKRDKAEADRLAAIKKADEEKAERIAQLKAAIKSGAMGKREGARLLAEAGDDAEAAKLQAGLDAESAKKAPLPVQKVLPNMPAISGLRRRLKWDYTIKDASKLKREYLMANDVEIGRTVRGTPGVHEDKTPEQIKALIEETCPGIEVTFKDAI